MQAAESFQQVRRTYIRHRGQTLSYFGGCDYLRLASHPKIHAAVEAGMKQFGLNVAASRVTTGNHKIFLQLEQAIARFFGAETAVLANSGYVTNLIVAQTLAGHYSHALIDERSHVALQDAVTMLNCPVLRFKHRDVTDFANSLKRCGSGSRPIVLTDGMFSYNGSVAPLAKYLELLPRDGLMVIDDAHGAGTLGATGRGSVEIENVHRDRLIQNITLSKAFGCYGGAILCSQKMRAKLIQSRIFVGSTPLPPPLAAGALAAVSLVQSDRTLRARLHENSNYLKTKLRASGFPVVEFPGPIVPARLKSSGANQKLSTALRQAKILPPFVKYPGGPAQGYFRFVICSEHTRSQLDLLARTLAPFAKMIAD
jgi:7-keto-8-aminopelargonate synthetase-like enzyme